MAKAKHAQIQLAQGFSAYEVSLPAQIAKRFALVGNPKSAILACDFATKVGHRALLS